MMFIQISIGLLAVIASVIVQTAVFWYALRYGPVIILWATMHDKNWARILVLSTSIVWVILAHILITLIWCLVYTVINIFESVATTLYFVLVTFTTLGFGDLLAPVEWQLLSGITASNGLLAFGASTAFQVQYFIKIRSIAYNNKV